jgi:hypothetical protein
MLHSIILVDPTASLTVKPNANTQVVDVLEGEKVIKVEQIRQLVTWLGQRGFEKGNKRAIVIQAQRWHYDAPHMLLKALEEPVAGTDIILTTDTPSSMLATIRSRCATYELDQIGNAQLAEWGIARGQPSVFQAPQSWDEFIAQSILQRWSLSDKWIKGKQNLAAIFTTWQGQIRDQPLTEDQAIWRVAQLHLLDRAVQQLQANVSPRLTFDGLLLAIDRADQR